uniref:Uncharacterized protein LOC105059037 isoform X2 n=1 Tax=Elaeis guineensis var. tenera TaxID=51953 RepID=A0A6I9SBV3_ELAGV|nr:uncharacterized protein LOC105059037 isoform X2 [Elaeis guineensis]
MASLRAPPSSFQLRLGRGSREISSVVLRIRMRPPHRRIRLVCAAGAAAIDGGKSHSWADGDPRPDCFSGWSAPPEISGSKKKGGLGRILEAGLVGIFLAAGVTFTSLHLKSGTGVKQEMKSLTTEQEVLLSSDDQGTQVDLVGNGSYAVLSDKEGNMEDCKSQHDRAFTVPPGKVVVPPVVDQVQGQALRALQVLKVIEDDVQPGDLCTRREYARWLVAASSSLSRYACSKVYPAMYIENMTELAFDDVTPDDPDFALIQGLAEAGLISSKLSSEDAVLFSPESPLSRQDLVSWKMALEEKLLPEVDINHLYQCSGFIDIDKINPDAWPALVADLSAGDQSITALAFGFTRLFQPNKPVTKAQAAIAIASGDTAEAISDELARIEAESLAERVVNADTALVDQVKQDLNASYEKDCAIEREKINALEKLAEEARVELEKLRTEREEKNDALMCGRAAVEAEMEALSRLRLEVEEQLLSLLNDKIEISLEKDRISKLRKEAERENQVIARLEYELEVERKALSMARCWAEEEAKRARKQARDLEEARKQREKYGVEVIVDEDLQDDASTGLTWLGAWKPPPMEGMITRAEKIVEKLKAMAAELKLKSNIVIEKFIQKIVSLIRALKRSVSNASKYVQEIHSTIISKARKSVNELCYNASGLSPSVVHRARRTVEDCREGLEIIRQKFKS